MIPRSPPVPLSPLLRRLGWIVCALGFGLSLVTASAQTDSQIIPAGETSQSIPFDQLGAEAQKKYSGDGIRITPTADGARLRAAFQKLEGQATREGLWLTSTADEDAGKAERFRVLASAVRRADGRADTLVRLHATGSLQATTDVATFNRPSVVEEYRVSMDGVRQDFLILQRPAGEGSLSVSLEVTGATVEAAAYGAKLTLAGSGRAIAYSRLRVTDATGKELTAHLEVSASKSMCVVVEDAVATYPVRIDPTFSDADWVSLNAGVPGANAVVRAIAVDGSGNVYFGGAFTVVGTIAANGIVKWNGSTWSALGTGVSGGTGPTFAAGIGPPTKGVNALAVSGSDLYVGGDFTTAGGTPANNIAKWNGSSWSTLYTGMNSGVSALAVSGSDLYAGGDFTTAGGIAVGAVAKWNGVSWSGLGTGLTNVPSVRALAVSGSDLYAGGVFTMAGGVPASCIAKWNGSAWSALGSGVTGGSQNAVHALTVSGTDLYVGGNFTTAGGVAVNSIAKWDGSSWSALGTGMSNFGSVYSLVVSGSDLYAGGDFFSAGGSNGTNGIAKWDGSAWSGFVSGLYSFNETTSVYALAVSGTDIYTGGYFTSASGVAASNIAKWNGSDWSALGSQGSGMNALVKALAVSGTDLFLGGDFTMAGGTAANYIAKWSGSTWSTLGTGMNNSVNTLTVSGTDLYAGGNFTTAGGVAANYIAKWNGSTWSALGTGMNYRVAALAMSGTDLYAGGGFSTSGGVATNYIAKWNGSSWSALGSGMGGSFPYVYALAFSGTNLYVGGKFTTAGGVSANYIAKWNGSAWSALGSGMGGSFPYVDALATSGTDLYAGGEFTTAGGITTNYIAKWNGSAWSALGTGMGTGNYSPVYSLVVSGTDIYAGGSFSIAGGVPGTNGIAKWNGSVWSSLGTGGWPYGVYALAMSGSDLYFGGSFTNVGGAPTRYIAKWNGSVRRALGSPGSGMNRQVKALAVSGTNLYVGGDFTAAGGEPDTQYIAKWNGSTWSGVGSGMNNSVSALALSGADLYAGGRFTTAGGVSASYIAKWNGTAWSALGSGMSSYVSALALSGTDLYAGGFFTTAGGVSANRIAKWNGTAWLPLGSGMGGSSPYVYALAANGADLYAGGNFTTADGVASNRIAKWNGTAWSALGTGLDNSVSALAMNGTDLYAGGYFNTAGGVAANRIAKWNGTAWSALGTGVNSSVIALAVNGTDLYVGGPFTTAGGVAANRIAKWSGSAWSALGSGLDNDVSALTVDASNHLFVGGNFGIAGTTVSPFIAEADLNGRQEIAVEQPPLTDIADGGGTSLIAAVGNFNDFVFTVRNVGSIDLNLSGSPKVLVSGPDAALFTVTAQPISPVAPGGSTTFTLRFAPNSTGVKNASLSIANDDDNENPFDIGLSGLGANPPTVASPTSTNIAATSATLGGNVTADGGTIITERGVVYSVTTTNANPLINGSGVIKVSTAGTTGVFTTGTTDLIPNTGYSFKAYATNGAGTSYSGVDTFTTTASSAGDLDPLNASISGSGSYIAAIAMQPDGKTILAGYFSSVLGVARSNIARLNADGTLDMGFDPKASSSVLSVAVQADGKILLGGYFPTLQPNGAASPTARVCIARLNADGTLDTGFDPNANSYVYSVAVQADGKILLGGYFTTLQPNGAASPTARQRIARLNADGTLDPTFDPKADNSVNSIAVQSDGKILIGGAFTTLQPNGALITTARQYIARVNTDGSLDAGFDPKANSYVRSVVVQADEKILLAGDFTTLQPNGSLTPTVRNRIARVNTDGTLDTSFDPKAGASVFSVATQTDGKILLAGGFNSLQPNGSSTTTVRNRIARVNTDGTLDTSFDPKANSGLDSVALQTDGRILLGGGFTTLQPNGAATATPRNYFARLLNDGASQSLNVPDLNHISWQRSGSGPEVSTVTFEQSTNGGATWTLLGSGTRVIGGWELAGLSLPASGSIRARGRTSGGHQEGLIEQVTIYGTPLIPEIAIEQPALTNIADGGSKDFGAVNVGSTADLVFTIKNTGGVNLTLSGTPKVAISGTPASLFTVTAQPTSPVVPSGSTAFTVRFAPTSIGAKTAALAIANDDADENPFIINLSGMGLIANATLSTSAQSSSTSTPVVLQVTGISTGGSITVERIMDADADGVVDAGEFLAEVFTITDGVVTSIGGVRNTNIPGDEDGAADGQISMNLMPATGPKIGRMAGAQIIRVSSPTAAFPAFNRTLTLTHPAQSQTISGTVTDGSNPVPYAAIMVLDARNDGEFALGAFANASGQFTMNAPAGSYSLFAIKSGYAANFSAGLPVALGTGASVTKNLLLVPATTTISGKVADAVSNTGLGGVQLFVQSQGGLAAILSTNADGTFAVPVTAGLWTIKSSEISASRLGYLSLSGEADANADTTSTAATGANISLPKATALIYGTVKNSSNAPITDVQTKVGNQGNSYQTLGRSAPPAGTYSMGVLAGNWSAGIEASSVPAGYSSVGISADITISAGQAVQSDFVLNSVTAHLRGQIRDDTGAPIPNMTLVLQREPISHDGTGSSYPVTDANGEFDLGVFAGVWDIALECVEAQAKGFVNVADLNFTVTDWFDQNGLVLVFPRSTFVITGTVKDNLNQPIAGVELDADYTIGSTRYFPGCVATDANGNYTLKVLHGDWRVSVRDAELNALGFNAVPPQIVTISSSNGVADFVASPSSSPSLVSSSPANNATDVGLNSVISFTFSEPMGSGYSINWGPYLDPSHFSFNWSADRLTLNCYYDINLPAYQTVNWTLNPSSETPNFRDQAGNPMPADITGSFTIGTNLGPEIDIQLAGRGIESGNTQNLGAATIGRSTEHLFTINNNGGADLVLSGTPMVEVVGADAALFTVIAQPESPVIENASTTFRVRFTPDSQGLKSAALRIANNDSGENPYEIPLTGLGLSSLTADNYANRINLGSAEVVEVTGSNLTATMEPAENTFGDIQGATVWAQWTAPTTGWVTIHTVDSPLDSVIGLYTGSGPTIAGLSLMGFNDESGRASDLNYFGRHYGISRLVFKATAGTTYMISVGGWKHGSELERGTFELHIDTEPTPPVRVTGVTFSPASVDVTNATQPTTMQVSVDSDSPLFPGSFLNADIYRPNAADYQNNIHTNFVETDLVSGTSTSGTYEKTISVPRYVSGGTWPVSVWASLYGNSGGNHWSMPGNDQQQDDYLIPAPINSSLTVTNSGAIDTAAPTLVSITGFPPVIDVTSGDVTFDVDITFTDGLSGFTAANIFSLNSFNNYSGGMYSSSTGSIISGNAFSGVFRQTITVQQNAASGTYYPVISMNDAALNWKQYSDSTQTYSGYSRISPPGTNLTFQIIGTEPEIEVAAPGGALTDGGAGVYFGSAAPAVTTASYDFSGNFTNTFRTYVNEGNGIAYQRGGLLRYHAAAGPGESNAAFIHREFQPRYDQSWSAEATVKVPLSLDGTFPPGDPWIDNGLTVGFTDADGRVFHVNVSLSLEPERKYMCFHSMTDTDGSTYELNTDTVVATTADESGVVRLRFDAATKTLTAETDTHTIFRLDLGTAGWGMTDSDTFAIAASFSNSGCSIPESTPVTIDNFRAAITSPVTGQTFTITNTGDGNLYGLQLSKDGPHAADFTLTNFDSPSLTLMTGQSATFTVGFVPTGFGARTATLHIASNDADENPFDITLTGSGAAMAPTALTQAPSGITRTNATLNGLVNSNGAATTVTFDYGPDTNYGSTIAAIPASVSSGLDTAVSATLNGLTPGTTWHYRVRATKSIDTTLGMDRSFTVPLVIAGEVDATFNPNAGGGTNSGVLAMAMQPDGKTIIGGDFTTVGVATRNRIARLNADGTPDAFNPNANSTVYSAAVQGDGKILVAGTFTSIGGAPRISLARLNANGSADATFTPNIIGDVYSLAVQYDGKILIAGWFTTVNGVARNNLARLNPDGTLDTSFNPAPNSSGIVSSIALQCNGSIIVGGQFTTLGGSTRNRIARLLPDGSLDSSFDSTAGVTGVSDAIRSIAVQDDGRILIGGVFTEVNGVSRNRIARLNADGTLDISFNPNVVGSGVPSMALQADGKIILTGDFSIVSAAERSCIARLNIDGSLDSTFNPGANARVSGAMIQGDGTIIIGGDFTSVGGVPRSRIARLINESATQSLSITSVNRVEWLRGGSSPETQQVSFELSTDAGTTWSLLGGGWHINGGWEITGMTLPSNGRIRASARVAGGFYNGSSGLIETITTYSGLPAPEIAVFDGESTTVADERADNAGTFNFGAQLLGSNVTRSFTIQNAGTANLNIVNVSLNGTSEFSLDLPGTLSSVPAGDTTTFTVTFSPTIEGVQTTTVLIESNDTDENPFEIQITANGQIPPDITTQPVSGLIGLGTASSNLSVSATGTALQYQWLRNDSVVPGATGPAIDIASATLGFVGQWRVRVSNGVGTVTSQAVNLGVIDLSTRNVAVSKGGTLNIYVAAAAPGGSYRWMRGGVAIPRGINPETQLTLTNIQSDQAGEYTCQVTMPNPQEPDMPFILQSGQITVHVNAASGGTSINQPALQKPVLLPFTPQPWIVGGNVREVIPTQNAPTRFAVRGLPAGVKFNPLTGELTGRPTVSIQVPTRYPLTITASNAAGSSAPLKTDVIVQPLPGYTVGSFHGIIERQAALNAGHGGRITLAVTTIGSFTGKLTLGAASSSFTGQLDSTQIGQDATAQIRITRARPLATLNLAFTIQRLTGELTGQVWEQESNAAALSAWRQAEDAATQVGLFAVTLTPAAGNTTYPQTASTLRLSISRTGVPSWIGRMADGATITGSSSLGRLGAVPLHQFSATTRSSLQGWLQLSPAFDSISGSLDWLRLLTKATLPSFPLHELEATGTRTGTVP